MTQEKLLFASLLLLAIVVSSLAICQDCDQSLCASTKACNISTLDECGCCHVCVRSLDEKCGGAYGKYGVCQKGLECVLMDQTSEESHFNGLCKDSEGNSDCGAVACPPTSFDCPWDSKYRDIPAQEHNNSCCRIPGACHCDLTRCNNVVCPPKYTKKLQSAAENSPGKCCDMFQCLPESYPKDVCVDPETGLKYDSGEYWQRDPCTPCTCFSGAPQCYNIPCPKLKCTNPIKLDNECCPECPGDGECGGFKCDLDCTGGFQVDDRGCPICQCHDNSHCRRLDQCTLNCPNGFKTGDDGCDTCKCHECQNVMKHCTLSCGYELEKDTRGCVLCKCKADSAGSTVPPDNRRCYDNDVMHEENETWQPNQCVSCTCFSGRSVCSLSDCDHLLDCKNPVQLPGQCCPVCRDGCVDNSHPQLLRSEQETWTEDCKYCSCSNGSVRCTEKECPSLQCSGAVVIPDQCCPVCPTVMQNIVSVAEREYVVVVAARLDLDTLVQRQKSFLNHLSNGNHYIFTLKLLFSSESDLRMLRGKSTSKVGCIALVKATAKNSNNLVLAEQVVGEMVLVEPDIVKIMTYTEYLQLSSRSESVSDPSKLSIGAIIGVSIVSLVMAVLLVLYATRRYMILSHRRQFKHTASIGRSADQLIHAVDNSRLDNNRLTINFNSRPRPSVDSMLSGGSPTPSDISPSAYRPVRGHDNLAASLHDPITPS